jgi:hypothetical protein
MWVAGETFVDAANNIWVRVDEATATGFTVTISNNVHKKIKGPSWLPLLLGN